VRHVVLFGATIPRQCLAAGLLNEIVIHLAPTLLGDGLRLYGAPGAERIRLEPINVGRSGELTDLQFNVVS
jgi:riboflavin biosynthesis pyrimidine reductase